MDREGSRPREHVIDMDWLDEEIDREDRWQREEEAEEQRRRERDLRGRLREGEMRRERERRQRLRRQEEIRRERGRRHQRLRRDAGRAEGRRREIRRGESRREDRVFSGRENRPVRCHKCRGYGHIRAECPSRRDPVSMQPSRQSTTKAPTINNFHFHAAPDNVNFN